MKEKINEWDKNTFDNRMNWDSDIEIFQPKKEDLMIGATPPSTIPTAVIQGGEKDKPKIKSLE